MTPHVRSDDFVAQLSKLESERWAENRFSQRIQTIREVYADLSARGIPHWPYFTLHDLGHVDRVLANLRELISKMPSPGSGVGLSALEVFVLVCATYCHDAGMFFPLGSDDLLIPRSGASKVAVEKHQRVFDEIQGGAEIGHRSNQEYGHFIREFHHLRSGIFVRKHKNAQNLQIDDWRGAIALVAEGHRKVDLYCDRYKTSTIGTTPTRFALLSALLRVADEFDVLRARVPDALRVINSKTIDAETRKHWVRHFCTEGLSISTTKYGSYIFEVFYKSLESDTEGILQRRVSRLIADGIEKELRYTRPIFDSYGIVIPTEVRLVPINTSVSVVSNDEISSEVLRDIFHERELSYHCPALEKHLGVEQIVTIEQRGTHLVCKYDELEHSKGSGSFCVASSGALLDCGFCAAFGTASIERDRSAIRFFCPMYSTSQADPDDRVVLKWEDRGERGRYTCQTYVEEQKEWCHRCGFGALAGRRQKIIM